MNVFPSRETFYLHFIIFFRAGFVSDPNWTLRVTSTGKNVIKFFYKEMEIPLICLAVTCRYVGRISVVQLFSCSWHSTGMRDMKSPFSGDSKLTTESKTRAKSLVCFKVEWKTRVKRVVHLKIGRFHSSFQPDLELCSENHSRRSCNSSTWTFCHVIKITVVFFICSYFWDQRRYYNSARFFIYIYQ